MLTHFVEYFSHWNIEIGYVNKKGNYQFYCVVTFFNRVMNQVDLFLIWYKQYTVVVSRQVENQVQVT